MSPLAAAALGVVLGLLAGAAVMVALLRRSAVPVAPAVEPHELDAVIGVLRSAAAIVGPHDELLAANPAAERTGLVRGTRIGLPAVLDAVRACRRDDQDGVLNVDVPGRLGRPGAQLAIRTVALGDERVFVVADDRGQALRAAESARDFMMNATHELKTPIGAISLLAEAVEGAADDPDAVAHFAGKISSEAGRLAALVRQILALSIIQGRPALASALPTDVDARVRDAIERCQTLADGWEVSLTVSGQSGLTVFADPEQLGTAIVNLIQNAIQYSEVKARVVVTTKAVTDEGVDWVDIAVSDNGIGLSPDDAARVFERFFRADYARSRATGGTGLGLSIVQEIAEGHGGTISVWSKPGAGSTFTLRLPATKPGEEGQA